MKNVANYISVSRMIMSIILFITETFSTAFYIIYIYCGISDMLDGFIARKSKNESKIGTRLDSVADIVFVIVAMIKILPILSLTNGIMIWVVFIVFIKIVNVTCSYIYYKKLVLPHTIANKITGFILFIAPFIIVNTNPIIFEIIICSIATFAAIQEGHYIRTRNYNLEENMIITERLKIYPISIEKMKSVVETEQNEILKIAYKEMLDGCLKHSDEYIWYILWFMELKDSPNVIVGNLSFKGIDESGVVEIGYGINDGYENNGYMTEAVKAMVEWASKQPSVKKVEAEAEEDNLASIRVLKKCNFVPNGEKGKEGIRFVWRGMKNDCKIG